MLAAAPHPGILGKDVVWTAVNWREMAAIHVYVLQRAREVARDMRNPWSRVSVRAHYVNLPTQTDPCVGWDNKYTPWGAKKDPLKPRTGKATPKYVLDVCPITGVKRLPDVL